MPHNQAANIVALRNMIEELIVNASNNPESILYPSETHGRLGALVRGLCRSNAGRYKGIGMTGTPERNASISRG